MRNSLFGNRLKRKDQQKAAIEGAETSAISLLEDDRGRTDTAASIIEEGTKEQQLLSDGETSRGSKESISRARILCNRIRTSLGLDVEQDSPESDRWKCTSKKRGVKKIMVVDKGFLSSKGSKGCPPPKKKLFS